MKTPPTLSVVIPNYNHAQYLPECLDSLRRQTFQPLEIIAVDDGSTDESVEVLRTWHEKLRPILMTIIKNSTNLGTVISIDRGIAAATGKYILLFASDDLVLPTYFEKAVALLEENDNAGLCFCDPASFNAPSGGAIADGCKVNENRLRLSATPCYFSPEELVKKARHKRVLIPGGCIFRTSALREYGGPYSPLKWHADFDVCYNIAFRHGACYIPEPLIRWRARNNSFMSVGVKDRASQAAVILCLLNSLCRYSEGHILKRFQQSGVLAFIPGAWRFILRQRKFWGFLNWALLRWGIPVDVFWHLPFWIQSAFRRGTGRSSHD